MAAGHAAVAPNPAAAPATAPDIAATAADARVPFGNNAPEATFSIAQVRETAHPVPAPRNAPAVAGFGQAVRIAPPTFRDIRAGRTAAAQRAPIAEVIIPVAEVEAQPTLTLDAVPASMEQMVERVRRRTAGRMSRAGATSLA